MLAPSKTSLWGRRGRCALLGAVAAVLVGLTASPAAGAATLQVADGGEDSGDCVASPCETIGYAVEQATDGDAIEVGSGAYQEQVTIDKALALRGPNAGVDPNAGSRHAEAVVDGGGGIGLRPDAAGVSIEGFTVTADPGGLPIYTGTGDIDGLTIADSIVTSGVRAITIETGGDGIRIERNRIEGESYGVILAAGDYEDLTVEGNELVGPVAQYLLFNAGSSTFTDMRLRGNEFNDGSSNIGGSAIEAEISGNSFELGAPSGLGLQIALHDSTVTGNSFDGHGNSSCLQLFGSQFGLEPSNGATVSGNGFQRCAPYGVQLSPDIDRIEISGNTIVDSFDGINTRDITSWDLSGKDIRVFANRIVGSEHAGVSNTVEGTLDARRNWWGCNAGPAVGGDGCDPISGDVDASPWLQLTASAEPAELRTGESATVSAALSTDSDGSAAAPVPDGVPVSFSTDLGSLSAADPALAGGAASATLSSDRDGEATVEASVDGEVVEVSVRFEAPPSPPSAAEMPPPPTPRLLLARRGAPLPVGRGRKVRVGNVACPSGICRVAIRARKIMVGRRGYPLRLRLRKWLAAGTSTPVTAILPRRAHRHLAKRGRGVALLRLHIHSGEVQVETAAVRLSPPGDGQAGRRSSRTPRQGLR